jgi:hypothetical protein
MKYFVKLVFGAGFMVLPPGPAIHPRFLLTWVVRLVGHVVKTVLRFVRHILHSMVYIFGTALLGVFIVGFRHRSA